MNTVTHVLELELYTTTSYPVVKAQQFDVDTRTLRILLKDHEEPYVLSPTANVYLIGERPEAGNPEGRSFLIEPTEIIRDPAIVSFDITQAITRAGTAVAKVKIQDIVVNNENENESNNEENVENEQPSEDPPTPILSSNMIYIDVSEEVAAEASMTTEEKSVIQELISEVAGISGTLITHISDNVRHLSQSEHERLNALKNITYSSTEPSSQQEGDAWLLEYQ